MPVGVLEVDLYLPECTNRKEKRQVLNGLKAKMRNRYNISVAEIDSQGLWQRSKLMIALASADVKGANSLLSQVISFIDRERGVHILNYNLTFF